MSLSDEEAYNEIENLVSQDDSFSDVPQELMETKHSIWEKVLNEGD